MADSQYNILNSQNFKENNSGLYFELDEHNNEEKNISILNERLDSERKKELEKLNENIDNMNNFSEISIIESSYITQMNEVKNIINHECYFCPKCQSILEISFIDEKEIIINCCKKKLQ